jgi:hypothetical protein
MGTPFSVRRDVFLPLLAAATVTSVAAAQAKPWTPEQEAFFEQKIRPLLIERCQKCHGQADKPKGGLRLDTRAGWQKGGDRGPAIVPGDVEASRLIRAVRYQDDDLKMPPGGRLSEREIALLEEWVLKGAPDPRDGSPVVAAGGGEIGHRHWAYQPLRAVSAPLVKEASWPRNEVDRFILGALEQKGMRPSPDTDPYTWLRRVSLDLTGLPPTPDALVDLLRNGNSEATWERAVDRLLASPSFGERWARPWLDLVGYADQIGTANNVPAEHAWRYRDYVIRALNADKPFDRFLREQLAGDLLSAGSIEERQDQLAATGFLVLGNVNIVETDKLVMRMDLVDQQIEKVSKAFLGLTLSCARCHDHKFDPVTLKDYYGLAGIFASTETTYKAERGVWSSVTKTELPETPEQSTARQAALRDHERQTSALQSERDATDRRLKELEPLLTAAKASKVAPLAELEKGKTGLTSKKNELSRRAMHLAYLRPSPPVAFAVKESPGVGDTKRQVRGNPHVLGETIPRGFVRVVTNGPAPVIPTGQSGRLQLAEWLTGPASSLMARVTVNRVWQQLFGRGIVASVDYFGVRGEPPSHPELLDALALRFLHDGWSIKRLVRTLVLSRTYRQTSAAGQRPGDDPDPENRLLGRMSPRRLDAEMLRDAFLAASGGLKPCGGGPALAPEYPENVGGLDPTDVNPISFSLTKFRPDQSRLRTIYLPVVRSSEQRGPADVLNFFDFPQPAQFAGARPTTTTASQALFLLNGPLLQEAAQRLADAALHNPMLATDDDRIAALALRVLNRPFTPEETSAARAFLAGLPDRPQAWGQLVHALFVANEFLFRM